MFIAKLSCKIQYSKHCYKTSKSYKTNKKIYASKISETQ